MPDIAPGSIETIDYDAARQRLTVVFAGGLRVVHLAVPSGVYAAFAAAAEPGLFYGERIRDQFRKA